VDFAHVGADQGSHDEWNIRRFRFGAKATMFREITLHTEVEFNPQEADPFYLRLTDANVQWSRSSRLVLTVGKHGVPFTMDGSTSSKELLAIERNNLTTNVWFTQEYAPGVSVAGNTSAWTYRVGVYSGGSRNREFGEFDGSAFLLTRLGYDFAKRLGVEKAELVGAYVYQDPDPQNTFTQPFKHVGSLTLDLEAGAWGLRTDVSGGSGVLGQGDILGVAAMPYYNLTEHAQLVGRYTFVGSPDDNAVVLSRYERFVVDGRGDRYNELYLGFNYFFYGHKLKLQTGVTFADLRDRANDGGAYSGTSGVLGLRTSW
jgi:phosphate-selective porin OprO/OprP